VEESITTTDYRQQAIITHSQLQNIITQNAFVGQLEEILQ